MNQFLNFFTLFSSLNGPVNFPGHSPPGLQPVNQVPMAPTLSLGVPFSEIESIIDRRRGGSLSIPHSIRTHFLEQQQQQPAGFMFPFHPGPSLPLHHHHHHHHHTQQQGISPGIPVTEIVSILNRMRGTNSRSVHKAQSDHSSSHGNSHTGSKNPLSVPQDQIHSQRNSKNVTVLSQPDHSQIDSKPQDTHKEDDLVNDSETSSLHTKDTEKDVHHPHHHHNHQKTESTKKNHHTSRADQFEHNHRQKAKTTLLNSILKDKKKDSHRKPTLDQGNMALIERFKDPIGFHQILNDRDEQISSFPKSIGNYLTNVINSSTTRELDNAVETNASALDFSLNVSVNCSQDCPIFVHCPFGFLQGVCPRCECAPDPCKENNCVSNQQCIRVPNQDCSDKNSSSCPQTFICEEIGCECPSNWEPVCGTHSEAYVRTYINNCTMNCHKAEKMYDGECWSPEVPVFYFSFNDADDDRDDDRDDRNKTKLSDMLGPDDIVFEMVNETDVNRPFSLKDLTLFDGGNSNKSTTTETPTDTSQEENDDNDDVDDTTTKSSLTKEPVRTTAIPMTNVTLSTSSVTVTEKLISIEVGHIQDVKNETADDELSKSEQHALSSSKNISTKDVDDDFKTSDILSRLHMPKTETSTLNPLEKLTQFGSGRDKDSETQKANADHSEDESRKILSSKSLLTETVSDLAPEPENQKLISYEVGRDEDVETDKAHINHSKSQAKTIPSSKTLSTSTTPAPSPEPVNEKLTAYGTGRNKIEPTKKAHTSHQRSKSLKISTSETSSTKSTPAPEPEPVNDKLTAYGSGHAKDVTTRKPHVGHPQDILFRIFNSMIPTAGTLVNHSSAQVTEKPKHNPYKAGQSRKVSRKNIDVGAGFPRGELNMLSSSKDVKSDISKSGPYKHSRLSTPKPTIVETTTQNDILFAKQIIQDLERMIELPSIHTLENHHSHSMQTNETSTDKYVKNDTSVNSRLTLQENDIPRIPKELLHDMQIQRFTSKPRKPSTRHPHSEITKKNLKSTHEVRSDIDSKIKSKSKAETKLKSEDELMFESDDDFTGQDLPKLFQILNEYGPHRRTWGRK